MKKAKYFILLFLIAVSCRNQKVTLHYYNGLNYNNNWVLASSTRIFFESDEEMEIVKIKNKTLKKELFYIRDKIVVENQILDFDDGYYTFAFITEKDTLFADNGLQFWKYKDKGLAVKLTDISKNKILEYYKISPNQY